MKTKQIQLLLRDLDYKKIKHITVTPSFYEVLEKKYGKAWAEEHCSINVPRERVMRFSKKSTYIMPGGRRMLQKMAVDK